MMTGSSAPRSSVGTQHSAAENREIWVHGAKKPPRERSCNRQLARSRGGSFSDPKIDMITRVYTLEQRLGTKDHKIRTPNAEQPARKRTRDIQFVCPGRCPVGHP